MLVRRPGVASLTHWRCDLTSETQHFEEEESDPVWAFTQLRRLGFGLVAISYANLMGLIRIARASAHHSNHNGGRFLPPILSALPRMPKEAGMGCHSLHSSDSRRRQSGEVGQAAFTESERSWYRPGVDYLQSRLLS
jgi:hypothetical protein